MGFSGSIPPKFEHKLNRHYNKKDFEKIPPPILDKENLLLSGLQ